MKIKFVAQSKGLKIVAKGLFLKRRVQMIVKIAKGYMVKSEKGRNLGGPYKTREEAKKRLRQQELLLDRK